MGIVVRGEDSKLVPTDPGVDVFDPELAPTWKDRQKLLIRWMGDAAAQDRNSILCPHKTTETTELLISLRVGAGLELPTFWDSGFKVMKRTIDRDNDPAPRPPFASPGIQRILVAVCHTAHCLFSMGQGAAGDRIVLSIVTLLWPRPIRATKTRFGSGRRNSR